MGKMNFISRWLRKRHKKQLQKQFINYAHAMGLSPADIMNAVMFNKDVRELFKDE